MTFPSAKLRRALWLYRLGWQVLMPLAWVYLWMRARKEPGYLHHPIERLGRGPVLSGAVWVHAVSLGEVRSAVPLIRALLKQGETILLTHATPAGRQEAVTTFAQDIAAGRVLSRYAPFDTPFAYNRFLTRARPKYGLVMEVEFWPEMILAARRHGVPLMLCNGQYPGKSFNKDIARKSYRADLPAGFAAVLVKSKGMADRFAQVGCANIHITGELRFAQPIPETQRNAGRALKSRLARPTVTLASVVAGEDDRFIAAIKAARTRTPDLFFVYVPRAPNRFGETAGRLRQAGLNVARRSQVLGADLTPQTDIIPYDILLGDSLGEMYFYLALSDRALVGGGFTPMGSHNIIEPLAMGKPVAVGPNISTIEYPGEAAIAATVATQVHNTADITAFFAGNHPPPSGAIDNFLGVHAGGVEKSLSAITKVLNRP